MTDGSKVEPFSKRDGVNWVSVMVLSIFHIGAVAAISCFSWRAFIMNRGALLGVLEHRHRYGLPRC